MPSVLVAYSTRDPDPQVAADHVARALPKIVAECLTIEGRELHDGAITEKQVGVQVTPVQGALLNSQDINITVFAHDYPERLTNFAERRRRMMEMLRSVSPGNPSRGISFSLLVHLLPTEWDEGWIGG